MARETVQACTTCGSLCRSIECATGEHKYLKPIVNGALSQEAAREKILAMIQEAKFNYLRLGTAITMLHHLEEFLQMKGHKFMHLEVKRTLESLGDRRDQPS